MRSQIKKHIFKKMYYKIVRKLKLVPFIWRFGLVLLILLLLTVNYIYGIKDNPDPSNSTKCEVTSWQRLLLFNLLKQVISALEKMKVTYFLCYASLWGAIQESGPLPWDSNAELCILSAQLHLHDEASIHRIFRQLNLTLEYKSSDGEYIVRNVSSAPKASLSPWTKLIVFEADSRAGGMLRRVGWKRRLLAPDCDAHPNLQCVPPHLVSSPLPRKSFGPLSIPVPKEELDFLKFHYPDTWWKPLKPTC